MPLPAALAARLAKRGLIAGKKGNLEQKKDSKKESKKRVQEEVIAEDYDNAREDITEIDLTTKFMGFSGCPNKYNIYHDCTRKCLEIWGKGHLQPTERYLKKQIRLVQKYPLPDTWKAIYDPGSGRHYYWDWSSDLVSWLPPAHPKSQISQPASQLREELHLKAADQDDNASSEESVSGEEPDELDEPEPKKSKTDSRDKDRDKDKQTIDFKRFQRPEKNKEGGKKDRSLDPMDPASYSDIPRGKWSDGLMRNNEAKTGADTTASGPLYQMRPYPNPGAVLRSNKASKPDEDSGKDQVSYPELP